MAVLDGVLEEVGCKLCGGDASRELLTAKDYASRPETVYTLVRCSFCGLVYVNPRPVKERIDHYYPVDMYYAYQAYESGNLKNRLRRIALEGASGFTATGGALDRTTGRLVGGLMRRHVDVVIPFVEHGKLLDVGCGNGGLFSWLIGQGWRVYGVDVNEKACGFAARRGLVVFVGELADARYPDGFFDVIVVNHVLEHIHDPLALLLECRRVLKDGGLIIVDVPNFGYFDQEIFREAWVYLDVPRHLYHYTQDTLGRMIDTAGFSIERWKFKLYPRFIDRASIERHGGHRLFSVPTVKSLCKSCFAKPIAHVVRGREGCVEFSINLAAYARKTGESR